MNKGIFYLILASLCYAVMTIFIRLINTQIPPFTQMFLRYFITFALSVIFVRLKKQSISPNSNQDLLWLITISLFGYTLSTVFFTFSIFYTTIATALLLYSTNVLITPILALMIIKEKISKNIWFAVILSLFGAILLFQPDFQSKNILGPSLAILASIVTSYYYVGRRKLKKYHASVIMLYSTLIGFITMAAASFIIEPSFYLSYIPKSISHVSPFIWFILFIFAVDNFFAWYLVNKGFETIKAGEGNIILLLEPIIGVIIGITIYTEIPTVLTLLGMGLILGSIIFATRKS